MAEYHAPASDDGRRQGVRTLPRNHRVVTITSFLTDISSEMVLNLLPLFWPGRWASR